MNGIVAGKTRDLQDWEKQCLLLPARAIEIAAPKDLLAMNFVLQMISTKILEPLPVIIRELLVVVVVPVLNLG